MGNFQVERWTKSAFGAFAHAGNRKARIKLTLIPLVFASLASALP